MKKPELLIPAGDMDSLLQAIHNGADAIYIGGKNYGARKFAHNFSNEEIKQALDLCHLYDVKLYVTMNTLIKDNEVEDFLNQVEYLHRLGIDAIIMQDFGMICLVREKYPNLEIHASTQANNSSVDTVRLFHKLGVKRVVLSRELSKEEIEKIDVPIEKEAFVHGALCISYSGCCLMSSMIGTRSGNRGECAGSCRLPYSLEYKNRIISSNKYLLSTKELNTSKKIKELIDSGIDSFKIEGRMKSSEYVGLITRYYRNLIDDNKEFNIEQEENKLRTVFNRGFTEGHMFNAKPSEFMNNSNPNHIGLEIGKVIEITPKKIKIKLNKELNQLDGIRFIESGKGLIINYLYDKNDNLVSSSNNICYIDNKIDLKSYDTVSKTSDVKLTKEINSYKEKKIPISIKLIAKVNENLTLEMSDTKNNILVKSDKVERATTSPTNLEKIKYQLEKLGGSPFKCVDIEIIKDENIFIPIKELNELRRLAVEKLIEKRIQNTKDIVIKTLEFSPLVDFYATNYKCASVNNLDQLLTCKNLGFDIIYTQDSLYEKVKEDKKIYKIIKRCPFDLRALVTNKSLINDYYLFDKDKEIIGDYGLNVYNIYTAYYLYKLGLKRLTLSYELTEQEQEKFFTNFYNKFNIWPNIEIICYGRIENMIIKDNILSLNKDDYDYNLIDVRKRKFPVYFDGSNTHILNYQSKTIEIPLTIKDKLNIRFCFYDEKKEDIEKIVNEYFN